MRSPFAAALLAMVACDPAPATAIVDDAYPPSSVDALVVYRAHFMTASFDAAVWPGASSPPLPTSETSGDTAYALLAPGWDPEGGITPSALVVLESSAPFAVEQGDVLHVPVSDATFRGRCEGGSSLSQQEAELIASAFFPDVFAHLKYDAASCTATLIPDAGP